MFPGAHILHPSLFPGAGFRLLVRPEDRQEQHASADIVGWFWMTVFLNSPFRC